MLLSEVIRYIAENVFISNEQQNIVKQRLLKEVEDSKIKSDFIIDKHEGDYKDGK